MRIRLSSTSRPEKRTALDAAAAAAVIIVVDAPAAVIIVDAPAATTDCSGVTRRAITASRQRGRDTTAQSGAHGGVGIGLEKDGKADGVRRVGGASCLG